MGYNRATLKGLHCWMMWPSKEMPSRSRRCTAPLLLHSAVASLILRCCFSDAAGEFSEHSTSQSLLSYKCEVWEAFAFCSVATGLGCLTEPQVNVCMCSWHLTEACLVEGIALSVFQCCSSCGHLSKGSICFNVMICVLRNHGIYCVIKWVHKAYKQLKCKCCSFTCMLNFSLRLFLMLAANRTQRGFQNFIKIWNQKHFYNLWY